MEMLTNKYEADKEGISSSIVISKIRDIFFEVYICMHFT